MRYRVKNKSHLCVRSLLIADYWPSRAVDGPTCYPVEIRARKAVMTKKEQVILKLEHGPLGIRNRETEVAG